MYAYLAHKRCTVHMPVIRFSYWWNTTHILFIFSVSDSLRSAGLPGSPTQKHPWWRSHHDSRVMMYKKAVSLFKAKTFYHSTLMNIGAMTTRQNLIIFTGVFLTFPTNLSYCFKSTSRPVLFFFFLTFLQRFLFSFVRTSIFLHKWKNGPSKGETSESGFCPPTSHGVYQRTKPVAPRIIQQLVEACLIPLCCFLRSHPLNVMWSGTRESIYCVFFCTLGTVINAFLRLDCLHSAPWNELLKRNFKLKNTAALSQTCDLDVG